MLTSLEGHKAYLWVLKGAYRNIIFSNSNWSDISKQPPLVTSLIGRINFVLVYMILGYKYWLKYRNSTFLPSHLIKSAYVGDIIQILAYWGHYGRDRQYIYYYWHLTFEDSVGCHLTYIINGGMPEADVSGCWFLPEWEWAWEGLVADWLLLPDSDSWLSGVGDEGMGGGRVIGLLRLDVPLLIESVTIGQLRLWVSYTLVVFYTCTFT